jgi:hypothetical protein
VRREANRGGRSGDLFGKLKADVKATTQPRKRSGAAALRILLVTRCEDFAKTALYLSSTKAAGCLASSVGQLSIGQSLEVIPHAANSRLTLD